MLEEKSMNIASQLASVSNEITMCLVNSSDPTRAILDRYDNAEDKHVFVAGLIGTLLLRHRQWQAAVAASRLV